MKEFNETIYRKCKRELMKNSEFLSYYYSPTLTVLKQFLKNLKNKNILEIGFKDAVFLDYLKSNGVNAYGIDTNPEKKIKI